MNELEQNSVKIYEKIDLEYSKNIIGQKDLLSKILICLFSEGHVLLEGVPGLAKTEVMKTIAKVTDLVYSRIQFTPDLLPADILGTQIFNQKNNDFEVKKGPLFANFILADEINRAPSKIQSALLQAMQEKEITIGEHTFSLQEPYFVIATQNPVEQEGTYRLSEAQIDRFMMKLLVDYPSKEDEKKIVMNHLFSESESIIPILNAAYIKQIKETINEVYIDEKLISYIINVVDATRNPKEIGIDPAFITIGASPRASIFLMKAAKANAYLQGKNYVSTEDIKSVVFEILNHRILLSYEAQAESMTTQKIIHTILSNVKTP